MLIEEAQNQLGILGQWRVRSSNAKDRVKVIKAEQVEIAEDYPDMT
jgi:hypothetical protein